MNRRNGILTAAACLAGLSAGIFALPTGEVRPPGACWVLIDFDSFSCGLCLDALLDFCRALPVRVQEKHVRGILTYRPGTTEGRTGIQAGIVRKKWDGFRKANDIRFPAFLDESQYFAGCVRNGGGVLLFDERTRVLKTFFFPLKKSQLEEVLDFLGQPESRSNLLPSAPKRVMKPA